MKEFLSREGVSYEEKNVAQDRAAANHMVQATGQMGVPVTEINGGYIIGFDRPALQAAVRNLRARSGPTNQPSGGQVRLGAQVADAVKVLGQPGAVLGTVRPGSLAEKAGLQEGDIILALNGESISGASDLAQALQKLQTPTPTPRFTIKRDGNIM